MPQKHMQHMHADGSFLNGIPLMTPHLCVSWNLNIQKNDPNTHITLQRMDFGLFRIMVLDYSDLHCAFFKPEHKDWFC